MSAAAGDKSRFLLHHERRTHEDGLPFDMFSVSSRNEYWPAAGVSGGPVFRMGTSELAGIATQGVSDGIEFSYPGSGAGLRLERIYTVPASDIITFINRHTR